MKVFACKRSGGYCGGLIVVAANNIEEAYEVYKKWGNDPNIDQYAYIEYEFDRELDVNRYPFENWYEIKGVEIVCNEPRVIDEDGYNE